MTSSIRRTDIGLSRQPVRNAPATSMAPVMPVHDHHDDAAFEQFMDLVRQNFATNMTAHGPHVFQTDVNPDHLYTAYLNSFRGDQKRIHTCNCCHQFIKNFGGLAVVNEYGKTVPLFWNSEMASGHDFPYLYVDAVRDLSSLVRNAKITGVYLDNRSRWGTNRAGGFTHMNVSVNRNYQARAPRGKTLDQLMAEKRQNFETLSRSVAEYPKSVVQQALTLLEADAFYRGEVAEAPTRFLRDLHDEIERVMSYSHFTDFQARDNVIWKALASAPIGFMNIRGGIVGTLLDDLKSGLPFEDASRKFLAKTQPDKFRRAQVAPKAGNIAAAERKVSQLGIERSLERRFARFEEIQTVWSPYKSPVAKTSVGVFSNVRARGEGPLRRPHSSTVGEKMTWSRFARSVLPNAERMEVYVGAGKQNFCAFVTAVHMDAPPILQWDDETRRNPVSWYVYPKGSMPAHFAVASGWLPVNGISFLPPLWDSEIRARLPQFRNAALFVIDGCRDLQDGGSGLFPEILTSDLHDVRSTIDNFSKSAKLAGRDRASACGLLLDDENSVRVNVQLKGSVTAVYTIEKWD